MGTEVKCRYAQIDGRIVDVSEVPENHKGMVYTCLACGGELIPVIGGDQNRKKHFRHKRGALCSKNVYLHNLAKQKIKARFEDESRPFYIVYQQPCFCSKYKTCELYNSDYCKAMVDSAPYDLHDAYNTCKEEKRIIKEDGKEYFVADLLLTHSQEKRNPLLIEIMVTHENSISKRNSGYRIIEVRIPTDIEEGEKMIDELCAKTEIRPTKQMDVYGRLTWRVRFDGFNPRPKLKEMSRRNITKGYLFNSGKIICKSKACEDLHRKSDDYAVYECSISRDAKQIKAHQLEDFELFSLYLRKRGVTVANSCKMCFLCAEDMAGMHICKAYRTKGTPRYPDIKDAIDCPHFMMRRELVSAFEEAAPYVKFIDVSPDCKLPETTELAQRTEQQKKLDWGKRLEEKRAEEEKIMREVLDSFGPFSYYASGGPLPYLDNPIRSFNPFEDLGKE